MGLSNFVKFGLGTLVIMIILDPYFDRAQASPAVNINPVHKIYCSDKKNENSWANWISNLKILHETELEIFVEFKITYGLCKNGRPYLQAAESPSLVIWPVPYRHQSYRPSAKLSQAYQLEYTGHLRVQKQEFLAEHGDEGRFSMVFVAIPFEVSFFWNLAIQIGNEDTSSQIFLESY